MGEQKKPGPKPGTKYNRVLTKRQARFVTEVKRRVGDGVIPSKHDITEAAKIAYDVRETPGHAVNSNASSLAGKLLNNAKIQEALGLTAEGRKLFFETVFNALQGKDPHHPGDKVLKMKAMQILSRHFVPTEEHTTVTRDDSFTGRSDAELEFFVEHGRWPEEKK